MYVLFVAYLGEDGYHWKMNKLSNKLKKYLPETNSEICNEIKKYEECIYDKLDKDHFEKYFTIARKYKAGAIDNEFKQVFASFYVLNGAGGFSSEQREFYFDLLKNDSMADFSLIMQKLYEIPRRISNGMNQHRFFLSFTTKLLHTKNNSLPIYDKNIACILGLQPQAYGPIEDRMQNRKNIYQELQDRISGLLKENYIKDITASFRKNFKENKNDFWDDILISDTKILDSILWALYTCKKQHSI